MTILNKAAAAVDGPRQKDYGSPLENHTATARLWNAYLMRRFGGGSVLIAEDVCMMNILQKVSRLAHSITEDGLVDVAGYARCVEMVQDERKGGG